jgi:beta-galactosidase
MNKQVAEHLEQYVEQGGLLVVTPRTGVKDETNAVVNHALPGLLAALCGIEIEEYVSMPIDMDGEIKFTSSEFNSELHTASIWCDVLKPNGAQVIAQYQHDYLQGKPAITINKYGDGKVVYIGTLGESTLYSTVVEWLLGIGGVNPSFPSPAGVEVAERWQDGKRFIFLLNHTDEKKDLKFENRFLDLLDGSSILEGIITIEPKDLVILLEDGD